MGQRIELRHIELKQLSSLLALWKRGIDLAMYDLHLRIIEMLHIPDNLRNVLDRVQEKADMEHTHIFCTNLLTLYVRTNPVGYRSFSFASECARILLR